MRHFAQVLLNPSVNWPTNQAQFASSPLRINSFAFGMRVALLRYEASNKA